MVNAAVLGAVIVLALSARQAGAARTGELVRPPSPGHEIVCRDLRNCRATQTVEFTEEDYANFEIRVSRREARLRRPLTDAEYQAMANAYFREMTERRTRR